jgi:hypothetical protein
MKLTIVVYNLSIWTTIFLEGAHQHISTLVAMDNKNLIMANNLHTIGASEVVSSVGNNQLACGL